MCIYVCTQSGVKKSVTYAKVIWNKINLLVTHKCVVLLLRHLHSHQIRNKSTWWALLVLWSYNWRSHEPCHMPLCPDAPLQPHSLQSKVGGIKFVLGRWVPQRLSCYKHFYCLVYQHTPFDPCPLAGNPSGIGYPHRLQLLLHTYGPRTLCARSAHSPGHMLRAFDWGNCDECHRHVQPNSRNRW